MDVIQFPEKLILTKKELVDFTINNLFSQRGLLITYYDFNAFNYSVKSNEYFSLIKDSFYAFQDGIGMYLALKLIFKNIDRIVSTNYFSYLIEKLKEKKVKIFVVGYNYKKRFIEQKFREKNIYLAGYYHGFFNKHEMIHLINKIKNSKAEFVFIGMGKPRQEFVAYNLRKYLPHLNYLCVGDFFNYYLGLKKRAPLWIRNLELEWFYRIINEPVRLSERYISGIPFFIYNVLSFTIKMNLSRGQVNYEQTSSDNIFINSSF
ncbi:WecB/TagA/CpsF family glycosyltransferase [Rosettibacter firmus]|uniref:WecB/TagA/CpsF family glycosyltransferase n=1 Tax=Rosettibacter firmus TaxID=3111522 RepID=UPI00336BE8E4